MIKYKIYCETDAKWEYVIASSEPTQCPIDNAHAVRAGSVSIVEQNIKLDDGTPKSLTLDDYKQLKINAINLKTQQLIGQGFAFDGNTFSASLEAQTQWTTLKTNQSDFTWPMGIATITGGEYTLTEANVVPFWLTGLGTVKAHIDSGRSLRTQVLAATDEAGVDAVVDNR